MSFYFHYPRTHSNRSIIIQYMTSVPHVNVLLSTDQRHFSAWSLWKLFEQVSTEKLICKRHSLHLGILADALIQRLFVLQVDQRSVRSLAQGP